MIKFYPVVRGGAEDSDKSQTVLAKFAHGDRFDYWVGEYGEALASHFFVGWIPLRDLDDIKADTDRNEKNLEEALERLRGRDAPSYIIYEEEIYEVDTNKFEVDEKELYKINSDALLN